MNHRAAAAAILAAALLATGCASHDNRPVVVQVQDAPTDGGRFRAPERQRDVWIAPQIVDNETLQHEEVVTFVEKPASWQLPSTLDPNTVSKPDLPLEEGDYDAEVLRRQAEMIKDKENQLLKTTADLENLKRQSRDDLGQKDDLVRESEQTLQKTREELAAATRKLKAIEETEKLKRQQEDEKQRKKPWWKLW